MDNTNEGYGPISCEFHDLLEVLATTRSSARIRFLDSAGTVQSRETTVADVFARDGAEYLTIGTGETVRLDRLLSVGDAHLSDYGRTETIP
jgi:Rho-binding antiterminator